MPEPLPQPPADPTQPLPTDSSGGEEDPGAALDDPVLRDAMRGEAQRTACDSDSDRAAAAPPKPR